MPREFIAEEIEEADYESLQEAYDDEYLLAHLHEKSVPWYLCDILFRPRLAVLRWTRDTDDRLRDRAMGIAAIAWGNGCLAKVASPEFSRLWQHPIYTILSFIMAFLLLNVGLAFWAKAYDVAGAQLGGPSTFGRMRVVLAMSWIPPLLVLIPINLIKLFFGADLAANGDALNRAEAMEFVVWCGAVAWSFAFTLGAIKAVQHFSLARALANQVLGTIYVALPLLLIGGILFLSETGLLSKMNLPFFK